jgi:putative DNA primase/helicase
MTRNTRSENWGRLLSFRDADGVQHEWAVPMEMLAGDGTTVQARLLDMGLRVEMSRQARCSLATYILQSTPKQRARAVSKVGWHGDLFVLPDGTIGAQSGECILLQTPDPTRHQLAQVSGTLEDWQQRVGALCRGNSRLIFGVSLALAAPLLRWANETGGGFHLRGHSSCGKTTCQVVAGSAWGGGGRNGYVLSWRSTANALEAVAEAHNDSLLLLDELGQMDPREAGEAAYLLANGQAKNRMTRTASLRIAPTWRLLFLSSGEIGLGDHVATVGKRMRAGQAVRMIDIDADAGAGIGALEDLHGADSADVFARQLAEAACRYYGATIREFLNLLTLGNWAPFLEGRRTAFLREHVPPGASGEVQRVAGLFALVAAAGELGAKAGVLPWDEGEAATGVVRCFDSWLAVRGGAGPLDLQEAVRRVRAFIESHGGSRFEDLDPDLRRSVYNRAGFRCSGKRGIEYLVLKEVFRDEVCAGYDFRAVARELHKRGHLITTGTDRLAIQRRIEDLGKPYLYGIRDSILEEQ